MAIAFFLLLLSGIGLAVLGLLGLLGRLPRNSWAGIRLPYTMETETRWYDTHRGAAPILIFGGIAVAAANLAFFPFALLGRISDTIAIAVTGGSALILLLVTLQAALVGVRYAQSRDG